MTAAPAPGPAWDPHIVPHLHEAVGAGSLAAVQDSRMSCSPHLAGDLHTALPACTCESGEPGHSAGQQDELHPCPDGDPHNMPCLHIAVRAGSWAVEQDSGMNSTPLPSQAGAKKQTKKAAAIQSVI